MPVQPTYPGVYVQEVPSGVRTIAGVSTSTALFVGRTKKGVLNKAVRCFSFSDFERTFADDNSYSDMARYVRLFFLNGGTDAYVMRIANGATAATVTLQSEGAAPADVLILTAKQVGEIGESIRAEVTYSGPEPESTFNMRLFRLETNNAGQSVAVDVEDWRGLTMAPGAPKYAPNFITQNSKLVNAALAAAAPSPTNGFSQSGRPVAHDSGAADATALRSAWEALIGTAGSANFFQLSVDGSAFVNVDLSGIDVGAIPAPDASTFHDDPGAGLASEITSAIDAAFVANGIVGLTYTVSIENGPSPGSGSTDDTTALLRITSDNAANSGSVVIRPASTDDAAGPLMLGTAQGGLEVGPYAGLRPAPTGITLRASDPAVLAGVAGLDQDEVTLITLPAVQLDGTPTTDNIPVDLVTTATDEALFRDNMGTSISGNNDGLREKLRLMRDAINDHQAANRRTFFFRAEVWGNRLALLPTGGGANDIGAITTSPTDIGTAVAGAFTENVRYYSVGVGGTAGNQVPAGAVASDGNPPQPGDYDDAYEIIEREVDLFNLLILPPDANPAPGATPEELYGPASVFCQEQRAFLLMDPPADWTDPQTASENVDDLRIGLVTDYSAVFYPRLTVNENGLHRNIGPAGAIAGLMARIDGTRGVWKAPAGTEADLRGVIGLEYALSDAENGMLNQRAINAERIFPNGIVNWGARTMDGDDDFGSEWKYVPIRRLALFIEESLYRGLKWVVFEPNDEPLWAQIRLNVGAFMHNLFRQGAFQGQTPKEAYFVKCDAETTTQNDRNLGIVNIWVGFAPLKPAEFVILYLQQMAGQIEV